MIHDLHLSLVLMYRINESIRSHSVENYVTVKKAFILYLTNPYRAVTASI